MISIVFSSPSEFASGSVATKAILYLSHTSGGIWSAQLQRHRADKVDLNIAVAYLGMASVPMHVVS